MLLKIDYFKVDENLMYLIQGVTQHSTGTILSYFYSMAMEIAEDRVSRHPGKRINKTLEWHYNGTRIPYKLEVYTGYSDKVDGAIVKLYVVVKFPRKGSVLDVTEMMNRIVESGLGLEGSEPLPDFPQPRTRVPAGFKKLLHK